MAKKELRVAGQAKKKTYRTSTGEVLPDTLISSKFSTANNLSHIKKKAIPDNN
jgi:hypothetical protein